MASNNWTIEQEKSVSGPLNSTDWTFESVNPDNMTDSQSPEHFRVRPEEVNLKPRQIQDGPSDWTISSDPE